MHILIDSITSIIDSANIIIDRINILIYNTDILYKDIDAYTLLYHTIPDMLDVGMCHHSCIRLRKPQGGITYYRKTSYDIINKLANSIVENKVIKEESYLPDFYKSYKNRFTWLNYRYNLFRQGEFTLKYPLCDLPIINCHFHLEDKSCTNVFIKGTKGVKIMPDWFVKLAKEYKLYEDN